MCVYVCVNGVNGGLASKQQGNEWSHAMCGPLASAVERRGHEWNTERCCFSCWWLCWLWMKQPQPLLEAAQQSTMESWAYFSHQHKGCSLDFMYIMANHAALELDVLPLTQDHKWKKTSISFWVFSHFTGDLRKTTDREYISIRWWLTNISFLSKFWFYLND